ncbi:unnamed protein product [Ilex paraguariensis]|uniref:Copia protein n=1 Tax=Ilex paraguariensis TaxID=185542 RepID=A0ABC8RWD6_9AQUA
MTQIVCEMLWVRSLLHDTGNNVSCPMEMHCNGQTTIFIASNLIFYERTKHIKLDYYFVRDLLMRNKIITPYIKSSNQLSDILPKPLTRSVFNNIRSKLGFFDLYAPT